MQSFSAQGMCTHTISMHTQDAPNFDAHLPFLQVACVPESYDYEKDPCLWKRQERLAAAGRLRSAVALELVAG